VLLLAVETATDVAGVALADDDGILVAVDSALLRRHAEAVAPAVAFACERAGVTPADLGALVVDVGPGLFTGLRVGLATVKALALALELPVATATSLEVLARAVAGAGLAAGTTVVPVVDARRGEVFSAVFEVKGGAAVQVGDDRLGPPDALARTVAELGRPCVLAGDGAVRYADVLSTGRGVELAGAEFAHPSPSSLVALGRERITAGTVVAEADVQAHYLRQADVRINWETRRLRPEAGA
jgi:tRNA threonylcarbamoyladenosine biosynthesis protein TsaB